MSGFLWLDVACIKIVSGYSGDGDILFEAFVIGYLFEIFFDE